MARAPALALAVLLAPRAFVVTHETFVPVAARLNLEDLALEATMAPVVRELIAR